MAHESRRCSVGGYRLNLASLESFVLMMSGGKHNSDLDNCFLPRADIYAGQLSKMMKAPKLWDETEKAVRRHPGYQVF